MSVDIYDENGVGGGASGVSGGLLHPYSPKGPPLHCVQHRKLWFKIISFVPYLCYSANDLAPSIQLNPDSSHL